KDVREHEKDWPGNWTRGRWDTENPSEIALQAFGDQGGEAEAAVARHHVGELLLGVVHGAIGGAVARSRALAGGAQDLVQEQGLELLGGIEDAGGGVLPARLGGRQGRDGRHGQITSISASRAPAPRRFWRIAMTSRGVEPMAASARTSSSMVAPCFRMTFRAFSSLAETVVCGTTSVVP